jgi:hypothetical protein
VAIEVTGDAVVVVNPAQCGEAAAGKANHRNGHSPAFAG